MLNRIEKIRVNNNSLWMEILWIALAADPDTTKTRIREIIKNDQKVTGLMRIIANG